MEKGAFYNQVKTFFVRMFDVRQEKENEMETIESIKKGVEFKGTNLWVLIFAIFVASLGLNTNSTAVIIGAMLISPLMGPIMGFGLGLGISDFELIKRAFRNFATATIFSVITSTLFFRLILRRIVTIDVDRFRSYCTIRSFIRVVMIPVV